MPTGGAREHATLTETLRWAIQYDQLDVTMTASSELIARRLVQIEAAVKKNPKIPDFSGLDIMLDANTDASGAAVTTTFNTWVADQQKAAAQISKQNRVLKEELDAQRKVAKKGAGTEAQD